MAKTRKKNVRNVLTATDERLVDARELLERFPMHRSTLNEMIADGRFPKPLVLGKSKLFWRWSTILEWLDEREKHPFKRRPFRNVDKANAANRARTRTSADSRR